MSAVVTNIYRAMMLEVERRRVALGLPMDKFCEYAGLSDRYYPKLLFADAPSGRQATWAMVEIIMNALFPHGYDLAITPKPGEVISASNLKAKLLRLQATRDPKSQRDLMRELGRAGGVKSGESRRRKAKARWRRKQQARRAARMRWRRKNVAVKSAQRG